ncbi:MAG: phosphoenolpyruvate--protein phosphotransferase [Proteobacteria bacterium]|nr:phosphoenolpyruvate--protein phosphotransferase [Pseudomonadota bacterium]MBU4471095.1 phosphoenolpyruvate--protein phosphotransferase [Pseudomonadota bacterium]MCG2750218.1 phosphoenolpyruvate--protein phosphotransferase [Desulfobacteraceae bacterium]
MAISPSGILENVLQIIAESGDPELVLDRIVTYIAQTCHIDVCSVYVLDPSGNRLILKATQGLEKSTVDKISMNINEGLTGLALETMAPVFVINPSKHERYKFYKDSGEELYSTFMGIPLVYHQNILGVLVFQTVEEKTISRKDIPFFSNLATQIAATVAYTGLLENLKLQKKVTSEKPGDSRESSATKNFLKGLSVTSGFAEGEAVYSRNSIGFDQIHPKQALDVKTERERLEVAFRTSAEDIKKIIGRAKELSMEDTAILEAHLMYLMDNSFKKKIGRHIDQGECAEFALKKEILFHMEFFKKLNDPYLRERASDIEDTGKRILGHLLGQTNHFVEKFEKPVILFASDISPVDLVNLNQENLKGIVLSKGGKTSHAVILAKSFEIPIIIGVKGVFNVIEEKDHVIMDASSGIVFRNPPEEIRKEYDRLKSEQSKAFEKLSVLKNKPAVTTDGFKVTIGANIGLLSDMDLVDKYGADYIGLYRTEFPFLIRQTFPSEEEQFDLYKRIVEKANGRIITIRTMDIGGDKFLNHLDSEKEANPFLGWRSVRISLENEDVFRDQIRAILRASAFGKARLLFPMISTVGEVRKIIEILHEEKDFLNKGNVPFDAKIQIGIMVEVPGIIRILDRLLSSVDFISIGTNDLVQYLLAVDRNNEKVAHLYNPLHPAVIGTILDVIRLCRQKGKPVCICGEAAANLACVSLFLGMGADCLSMNPASIPVVKNFIRELDQKNLAEMLGEVLKKDTAEEVQAFLSKNAFFHEDLLKSSFF